MGSDRKAGWWVMTGTHGMGGPRTGFKMWSDGCYRYRQQGMLRGTGGRGCCGSTPNGHRAPAADYCTKHGGRKGRQHESIECVSQGPGRGRGSDCPPDVAPGCLSDGGI